MSTTAPRYNPDDEDPPEPEQVSLCDSGRSPDCTGRPTILRAVPYLRDKLHLCASCDAYETKLQEDGPEYRANDMGFEGGVNFDQGRR